MMVRLSLVLFFMFYISVVLAQTPVMPDNVDTEYLSHLIKKRIDELRIIEGKRALHYERHLQKSSGIQAKFLSNQKKLTHKHTKTKLIHAQDRTEQVGGKGFYVTENIGYMLPRATYEVMVDSLIAQLSKNEYYLSNIFNPKNVLTGITVLRKKDAPVYIYVQTFSSKGLNEKRIVKSQASVKIHTKRLPYGIKPMKYNEGMFRNMNNHPFYREGDFFVSSKPERLKKIFKHKKDGIVFEIVFKDQVECESETYKTAFNRRNNNSTINGYLINPIYKKNLVKSDKHYRLTREQFEKGKIKKLAIQRRKEKKYKLELKTSKTLLKVAKKKNNNTFYNVSKKKYLEKKSLYKVSKRRTKNIKKEKWRPFYWHVNVPSLSYFDRGSIAEINMLILERNRILYPVYNRQYQYHSEFNDSLEHRVWTYDSSSIVIQPKYYDLSTEITFERNQTNINSTSFDRFKDQLKDHLIDSIMLEAFSSVEGNAKVNAQLSEARAEDLYQQLEPYSTTNVTFNQKMSENWPVVCEQIDKDERFSHWQELPQDSIRSLINDHKDEYPWKDYLKQQRSAKVKVVVHKNRLDTMAYLKKRYNFKEVQSLKNVQNYMLAAVENKRLKPNYVYDLKLKKEEASYSDLILNRYMLEYNLNKDKDKLDYRNFSRRFLRSISLEESSSALLINYLDFLVIHWDQCKPDVGRNVELFKTLVKRGLNTRAMSIFAMKAYLYYRQYFINPKLKYYKGYAGAQYLVKTLPQHVYQFYSHDVRFQSKRINYYRLANFFIGHHEIQLANQLLQDYQDLNGYDEEFKVIQMKLAYRHPFVDDGAYVKQLMEQYGIMKLSNWCQLFNGDNPISFQVLDHNELRTLYCKSCLIE